MQKRILPNLILHDEDYLFEGDLTVEGEVNITNGCIIVSGKLVFHSKVKVEGGPIMADSLKLDDDLSIIDGDIIVTNLEADRDIISCNGNIEVSGNTDVFKVSCLNYLVSGNNSSTSITAIQDIYIMGENESHDMVGRDIFIGGTSNFNYSSVTAKSFHCCGSVSFVSSMMVG